MRLSKQLQPWMHHNEHLNKISPEADCGDLDDHLNYENSREDCRANAEGKLNQIKEKVD